MKAEAKKVVAIEYELRDDSGEVLDSSEGRDPLEYLHGASNIVPGLEKAIDGKDIGETVEVKLTPEDGYGNYDEKLVRNVPVRKLSEKRPQVGAMMQVNTEAGPQRVIVKALRGDYATLDFNHPLAGKTLNFKVTIKAVREPTPEELDHGHVHGPGHAHGE
jgi:FKBP-type peptidyl-prolyl cis-trans isomerase SlyD